MGNAIFSFGFARVTEVGHIYINNIARYLEKHSANLMREIFTCHGFMTLLEDFR